MSGFRPSFKTLFYEAIQKRDQIREHCLSSHHHARPHCAARLRPCSPAEVTETAGDGDGFDWNKLIDAIAHFESKGNARAVNGQYVGLLQISPVLVRECNNILKARGESKRYTLKDRYNAEKSREMFAIIQSHHNPSNSIERAIRIWKGGIGYSIRKTQNYVNRVLERMGL